jgi:hypothetical protein
MSEISRDDTHSTDHELARDPRWRRIHDRQWTCPCCGGAFHGIPDLACDAPDQWRGPVDYAPNSALDMSGDFLSADFCVLDGEHYIVRCVLELPIIGSGGEVFGYGVWSSLSEKNFQLYLEHFDNGEPDESQSWFGWFCNNLKGYPDTFLLKCQVHPRTGRQRPLIALEPSDHPLAVEQRQGITFDRLLEIHAANGHDLGAALSDA